jgi:hypothetical protein
MTFAIGEHLLGMVGLMLYAPITRLFVKRYWRVLPACGYSSRGATS